jgi:hypothetical protein
MNQHIKIIHNQIEQMTLVSIMNKTKTLSKLNDKTKHLNKNNDKRITKN